MYDSWEESHFEGYFDLPQLFYKQTVKFKFRHFYLKLLETNPSFV